MESINDGVTFDISGDELLKHINTKLEGRKKEAAEEREKQKKIAEVSGFPVSSRDFLFTPYESQIAFFEFYKDKIDSKRTYRIGFAEALAFEFVPAPQRFSVI